MQDALIKEALTHRSVHAEKNNERLEFFGDAILDSIVSEILYFERPHLSEGGLTRMRSYLVRKSTLASVAKEINLAEYIIVGRGEAKSGVTTKNSLLANAFEAVLAAIHILRGRAYTKKFILKVFSKRLADLPEIEAIKDSKSKLQELLQAHGLNLPSYAHEKVGHSKIRVWCKIDKMGIKTTAEEHSKQIAEQEAASLALTQVRQKLKSNARK